MTWANKITGANSRPALQFDSRGFRRGVARPNRILHVITGISPFALLIYFVSNAPRDLGDGDLFDDLADHLFDALSVGSYLMLVCGLCLVFAPVRSAR